MIQKDEIRQVLESAKALGIEFAELFFEDTRAFKCLSLYKSGDKGSTS